MSSVQPTLAANHTLSASWVDSSRSFGIPIRSIFLKRMFDLAFCILLLAIFLPIWIVAALWIRLTSRGPILFRQTRVGFGGHHFTMLKFRSMTISTEDLHRNYAQEWIRKGESARQQHGSFKIADDPRITAAGRFLRKFSLDELPQLWNVLLGDMSLIGPRPALPYEVALYEPWHRHRLGAMPGLTGLWQVSGRNRLTFDQMVELDLEYIRNWTLMADLKILVRTIPVVLGATGH